MLIKEGERTSPIQSIVENISDAKRRKKEIKKYLSTSGISI